MVAVTSALLWEKLSQIIDVQLFGVTGNQSLKTPVFYTGKTIEKENCVVISATESLPAAPDFPIGTLLICVGDIPSWNYTKGKIPVIWARRGTTPEVFNLVLDIFELYYTWSAQLDDIVNTDADLMRMVRVSLPIFGNPLALLDREMYHIAITTGWETSPDPSAWSVTNSPALSSERVLFYEDSFQKNGERRDFYSTYDGVITRNLFIEGRREACITLAMKARPIVDSDYTMLDHLAGKMELALRQRAVLPDSRDNALKEVLLDLIRNRSVSNNRMEHMRRRYRMRDGSLFRCMVLHPEDGRMNIPTVYYCTSLENLLSPCAALEYEGALVVIAGLNAEGNMNPDDWEKLRTYLIECRFQAGASEEFSDFRHLRVAYRQACNAYEVGVELEPTSLYYDFRQYALSYMLLHSTGEFTMKEMIPRELRLLQEKCTESDVDYWNTLKLFLENDRNVAQTARELFLHRSSLLGRLDRIYAIIGNHLDDPQIRLKYRMILQLHDINRTITDRTDIT